MLMLPNFECEISLQELETQQVAIMHAGTVLALQADENVRGCRLAGCSYMCMDVVSHVNAIASSSNYLYLTVICNYGLSLQLLKY